jgi:hypothetical protein
LKAALINNPPQGIEGELYAEISRSKPAPQGICVANSDGKVLAWTLSFEHDASIDKFLDYAKQRYQKSPDASQPVTAERFMKFPGGKLADIADTGHTLSIPDAHSAEQRCPAHPALERGTLAGRIIGRPLDSDGQPIKDTARQEDYMEARVEFPVSQQQEFARALSAAPKGEDFAVPAALARQIVSQAYLGQLDVNPLGGRQKGARTDRESITFTARRIKGDQNKQLVLITGTSDVAGGPSDFGARTDGRSWDHQVSLTWEGYFDVEENRISKMLLTAKGSEQLHWANRGFALTKEPDVAHLMAGHPIDLDCQVRYGLIAEPCPESDVASPAEAIAAEKHRQDGAPINAIQQQQQQQRAHLREAVKHLRAAGVTDLANQIAAQVERMEKNSPLDRKGTEKLTSPLLPISTR